MKSDLRKAFATERATLWHGDCANIASVIAPESIDAIVTDPPAGISFMGKAWDGDKGGRDQWIAWLRDVMRTAMGLLKPGGHALVWALPRTSHWTATAIEDAGFEIRDVVVHLFGTGFPKSLDVSKAVDPDDAARFTGVGTALKPGHEAWILARKPLAGTVAANAIAYGTGGLRIDDCRIGASGGTAGSDYDKTGLFGIGGKGTIVDLAAGRFPANVTLDEEAAAMLDEMSGPSMHSAGAARSGSDNPRPSPSGSPWQGPASNDTGSMFRIGDTGGASRFFYVAKAPRAEKDAGLDHLPLRTGGDATDREDGSAGLNSPRAGSGRTGGVRNHHPTVKSIALMRWLCRLITPPGGIVLDLFAGSGTTGLAALAEGLRFVGVEREAEFVDVAAGRLAHVECVAVPEMAQGDAAKSEPLQPSLFGSIGGAR